ncbi:hypothetical protein MNVI_01980 [Mycobacterium noviomagense]|uniref:Uncharacterized protein n=1 Tax=Mycobacterium noviomagense TaxID=459858 RepID=A0A7I7P8A8_9MYCO|nr:hypothetical protein MNVI_01980 [Mycobacterium noviomagense]
MFSGNGRNQVPTATAPTAVSTIPKTTIVHRDGRFDEDGAIGHEGGAGGPEDIGGKLDMPGSYRSSTVAVVTLG